MNSEHTRLGNSGLEISPLVYGSALTIGTERVDQGFSDMIIDSLWDLGIRTFDTSNNYGAGRSETLLGKSLQKYPRHDYVLSTKGSWALGQGLNESGLGRKHLFDSIDNSLNRLGVDFIDVYYAHRFYEIISMEQIIANFNLLISKGKILHWGVSEWPLSALEECFEICNKTGMEGPIVQQNIYSYAIHPSRENGLLKFAKEHGMGFIGYAPFAQGLLTGKYLHGIPEGSRIDKAESIGYFKTANIQEQIKDKVLTFLNLTSRYELNPTHAAIAWVRREGVVPLFGASSREQVLENLESLSFQAPNDFWIDLDNHEY